MTHIPVAEAQKRLSELIASVSEGEEVVIEAGHDRFRLVQVARSPRPRKGGGLRGKLVINDSFDDPLDAFEPYT